MQTLPEQVRRRAQPCARAPQMQESVQPLLWEFPVGREDLENITK